MTAKRAIQRKHTDARGLTLGQVEVLVNWCGGQATSTFEDRAGEPFPLQAILDLYHASVGYETFDSWQSERPRAARRVYDEVCRQYGIKHG